MRRTFAVAVTFAIAALGGGMRARQAPVEAYDLVILNGRIVDGTGAPARAGDIAVRNGRIAKIGRLATYTAAERIDATGLVVAPGFIDVHTHADDLADAPLAENFIRMGVTTIVAGNCGTSALDIFRALNNIREARPTVNFATFIGHNTVRGAVLGAAQRDPFVADSNRMRSLVFRAMAEGAIGFSTGLHDVPGIYAKSSEIVDLARVSANEGGIYATHLRNEGTQLIEALNEAFRVAWLLAMPIEISHLKVDSPKKWGTSAEALKLIDDSRKRGVNVQADVYAYTSGASSLSFRFPAWALAGGDAQMKQRLRDPATWLRIKKEMQDLLDERGFPDLAWATVGLYPPNPSLNGRSMRDVALTLKGNAEVDGQLEAARDLMLAGGASMVYRFMTDDDVERIMKHPLVSIASDAGVSKTDGTETHPRASGNNARVLAVYVRERKVLTLEEAVRKMTSLPADFMGFADRGVLKEGASADIVLFDAARVRDVATFEKPGAAPEGIPTVIVNGSIVLRDGRMTGEQPGETLRRTRKPGPPR